MILFSAGIMPAFLSLKFSCNFPQPYSVFFRLHVLSFQTQGELDCAGVGEETQLGLCLYRSGGTEQFIFCTKIELDRTYSNHLQHKLLCEVFTWHPYTGITPISVCCTCQFQIKTHMCNT